MSSKSSFSRILTLPVFSVLLLALVTSTAVLIPFLIFSVREYKLHILQLTQVLVFSFLIYQGITIMDPLPLSERTLKFMHLSNGVTVAFLTYIVALFIFLNYNREQAALKKKIHELETLHEVSQVFLKSETISDFFDRMVKVLSTLLSVTRVSIFIYNPVQDRLEVAASVGAGSGFSGPEQAELVSRAFSENTVLFDHKLQVYGKSGAAGLDNNPANSCIIYPLSYDENPFGVLCISERRDGQDMDKTDFQLVKIVAPQIILEYENFILQKEMVQKQTTARELERAAAIQKDILPDSSITPVGLQFGSVFMPANTTGGDFYDYYYNDRGGFTFLIADVSGKSLPAAIYMSIASAVLRTIVISTPQDDILPGEILHQANRLLLQFSTRSMFVTTFLAQFSNSSGVLRYATAGHNYQLLLRAGQEEFEFLSSSGPPLAVTDSLEGSYPTRELQLEEGDIVILYTDGVTEFLEKDNDSGVDSEFGMNNLQHVVRRNRRSSSEEICQAVRNSVLSFTGRNNLFDDFTLCVIKKTDA
jgi:sigma-B regulation protein RsbU (phosphoserine phosphatase)